VSARIIACLTEALRRPIARLWILCPLALAWLAWLLTVPPRPSAWIVAASGLPLVGLASWLLHRTAADRWRTFVHRTADLHMLALLLLFALGVQFEDAHGITTDGVIYFSQLRSVIFDGDLDVAAEFAFLGQPPRPYHVVPIGPTIVWLPLYLAVAAVDASGRAIGAWGAPADSAGIGLTLPYVRAALVSSFAIGAAGLLLVHRLLSREFASGVAFTATVLLFGATPLVWYMVYEPSMTHAASFGFVAMFIVAATRWTATDISPRRAAALGACLGLAFISRPQEVLFALYPALLLMTAPAPAPARLRAGVRLAAWALAGAAPFLAAQAIHSAILFSREQFSLVGDDGYLDLFTSRWDDTLWSSWHGFLSWTPVAYIALLGVCAYARRRWRWTAATLLIVFLMAWVNGSAADWAAGWSFGGRRFTSCLVLLAPGLALVIHHLTRRPMIAIGVMALAAIGWNQLLLAQYSTRMLGGAEPVSFGRIVRQQAEVVTRPPFVYPWAFPANVWFAWRTGLPVDRYDLLAPEPLRPSLELEMGAAAGKFLLDGWGPRASDEWGDLRWMEGRRAEMVLPLDVAAGEEAQLVITARTRLLDPPVRAEVTVSVNDQHVGTFAPEAERPSTLSFRLRSGSPALRRGFNRVVFEHTASAVPVAIYKIAVTR
jgi:hypothetical protein